MWTYFISIGIGILFIIWVLQICFVTYGYENMKIQEVDKTATLLKKTYIENDRDFTKLIQKLSITNDFYVMMESNGALLLFTPERESTEPVYKYQGQIPRLKEMLKSNTNPTKSVYFKFGTTYEKYSTLAHGSLLDSEKGKEIYLYIFSPLYPVNSTLKIFKDQLVSVTVITLFLTFMLSVYLSNKIAKPIKSITSTSKQMGTGDYNVKFEGDSFTEINNLANTLNVAAYELGMADIRQKDLIANVSHDLKTPLTMVRSYAEMIRDLSGDNPQKREKHLNVIIDESIRMANLVSDMATISAMRTAKIQLNRQVFDLSKTAASILASYSILEEQEGYVFKFTAPKECLVYGDEEKIKQVIANLTSNAVKYCGKDKFITLTIKKVGKKYRLEVSDNGPGIASDELSHVWDRYYKTSTNYIRATTGTGLGLSIVKEILTLHHAKYGVESTLGEGTTFWFEMDMSKLQRS